MVNIIALFVVLFFIVPGSAHAYLDPGTGSYLFQIIIASLLAGGYYFKDKLRRIINLIKNLFTKKSSLDQKHDKKE